MKQSSKNNKMFLNDKKSPDFKPRFVQTNLGNLK